MGIYFLGKFLCSLPERHMLADFFFMLKGIHLQQFSYNQEACAGDAWTPVSTDQHIWVNAPDPY